MRGTNAIKNKGNANYCLSRSTSNQQYDNKARSYIPIQVPQVIVSGLRKQIVEASARYDGALAAYLEAIAKEVTVGPITPTITSAALTAAAEEIPLKLRA